MKNLISIVAAVVIMGFVGACSPSSQITSSWVNPSAKPHYSLIMVAAMTSNVEAKSIIEKDLTNSLSKKGVEVSKSIDVFPPKFNKEVTKEDMIEALRKQGSGAILTVTMVDKETKSHYVNGSNYGYGPYGPYAPMYGRFGGYYNYMYPMMYSPGYYTQDKVYYMETNLYDAKSEELVWSARSETYNPGNLSGFSQELANIISDKLEKDGFVGKELKAIDTDKRTVSSIKK